MPLDFAPLPTTDHFSADGEGRADQIKLIHQQVHKQIINKNNMYQRWANMKRKKNVFQEGDLVWVHLNKEHFPSRASKLNPRADGPFKVLKRMNDNAYKIDLPGHYNVPTTFNVADISPFVLDINDIFDLRTSPFEEGEDDAIGPSNPGPTSLIREENPIRGSG